MMGNIKPVKPGIKKIRAGISDGYNPEYQVLEARQRTSLSDK
tara:strand:+ start:3403 stop:3528 length:126 start_codon:yes stop_codon:yes gene_type:complete